MLATVSAALIDLFDTLVWSEWSHLRDRLASALEVEPSTLSHAYEVTYSGRQTGAFGSAEGDMTAVIQACGLEVDPATVRTLTEVVSAHLAESIHLYDDSLATLRGLRAGGVRTALVSNSDHFARPIVDALGLEHEVDSVVLSFEVGVEKPNPRIYLTALEALGAGPEESIFVDDQPTYLDGAAALGIRTYHMVRDHGPFDGHGERGRHEVITELRSLL